ncbi:Allophanate hydrolase subunit 1 [Arcobacter nitrofigilis DSM 7299]|uniref:Allophanate hydrolase subunit 1 n=1 Tax=Arcobacter nitrofigilis (strain ATCC 33309 / DSM 7299 / CCUG 15893 / LMG 7604 / NCTC 12251 / CI) TaxID=572480 RepID=D5V4P8_ARCNC|nr:5-oxoprolinase subunit PxpB [Arcobacter nitrofigilis]ADG92953.1 Allophanate hydrolase subunit 1 [Arcobacter nitrofigilis DSM 7299]
MIFKVASVDSLVIYFGNEISKEIAQDVQKAYLSLRSLNIEGLIEIIPSYTTIYISYDIFKYDYLSLVELLKQSINLEYEDNSSKNIINIDVYYGQEVGLDLSDMSTKTKLPIEKIIEIHSQKLYDVYAIGFAPGFGFLASVDKQIAVPRLSSPRKSVPKGSVAIADRQTAVYPQSSPGGWNIIGRTAMELFDKSLEKLSPLSVGDKVKFNAISKEEFLAQGGII